MSIHFEKITKETLYIALEIILSNPEYNVLENDSPVRTLSEIEMEFLIPTTESFLIKNDDTYIGILDCLMENPNDHSTWLGLLMIHGDYRGFGFGSQAFALFEKEMVKRGVSRVRIGVIKENTKAHSFWKSLGFNYYQTVLGTNNRKILCYEILL